MRNKKQSKDCNGRLPIPRKVKRGFFFYTAALVASLSPLRRRF